MRVTIVVRTALRALFKNKMRSFLTALGIIIGVAAVISMVSMGTGAKQSMEEQIEGMGKNILMVWPGSWHRGGRSSGAGSRTSLKPEDAEAIAAKASAVSLVSPVVSTSQLVIYGNMNWFTRVYGAEKEYFQIRDWDIESGRMFTASDANSKVCLLGKEVVRNLFGDEDPLGRIVRIKKLPFKVIGVLKEKGQSMFGSDQDDSIFIPFFVGQKRILGITHANYIYVSAVSGDLMETATSQIEQILRQRHKIRPGKEDDFRLRNSADLIERSNAITTAMTLLLGGIASVSLIVGGIGIMNIMLVSVVERTREIGIRMAVGGRPRDILRQFLIEAVVLSVVGGSCGIALGAGATILIANVANWPTAVSLLSVVVAFAFSAAIGIFFGFYPAMKASKLDPIEALRYE